MDELLPFVKQIAESKNENIILVSRGGTLSIMAAIWFGLEADDLNHSDFGYAAGGVSVFHEDSDGKRTIKRLNDMSFLKV